MLDLVEGAKIISGGVTTTGLAATSSGADWINMENLHCVWAICSQEAKPEALNFSGFVADTYAGANPVRATCQYWRSTGLDIDVMVASTQTTGLALSSDGGMVAVRFDPASRPNSTQQYFSVEYSSGKGAKCVTYIAQPRYGGLGQILATSSST